MTRPPVALRTEGVDRNLPAGLKSESLLTVALRTEGVDRNITIGPASAGDVASPSARRAWIEIFLWVLLDKIAVGRPPHGGRG